MSDPLADGFRPAFESAAREARDAVEALRGFPQTSKVASRAFHAVRISTFESAIYLEKYSREGLKVCIRTPNGHRTDEDFSVEQSPRSFEWFEKTGPVYAAAAVRSFFRDLMASGVPASALLHALSSAVVESVMTE